MEVIPDKNYDADTENSPLAPREQDSNAAQALLSLVEKDGVYTGPAKYRKYYRRLLDSSQDLRTRCDGKWVLVRPRRSYAGILKHGVAYHKKKCPTRHGELVTLYGALAELDISPLGFALAPGKRENTSRLGDLSYCCKMDDSC